MSDRPELTESGGRPRTVPVRLPDDVVASLKRVAAAKGSTPGAVLAEAWEWWWNRHGDAIVSDLHAAIEAMRP